MSSHADTLEQHPNGGYEASPVYEIGMLRREITELHHAVQLISPKSNEELNAWTVALQNADAYDLLPYDRNRVRATIQVPANQPPTPAYAGTGGTGGLGTVPQLGGVFVGRGGTVRAGGGFYIPPGGSLIVESIGELAALATANPVYISVAVERQGGDVI